MKRAKQRLDITDKNDIADLTTALRDIEKKYPSVIDFLEQYCGFYSPMNTAEPYAISYSQGKRDVILTIKTLLKGDLTPAEIAQYYKQQL